MTSKIAAIVLFLAIFADAAAQTSSPKDDDDKDLSQNTSAFPPGDPRACLGIARKNNFHLRRFSALPGVGWDNLRNVATGQVVDYLYTRCKMTEDGRFLIPDDIFTIPVKTSSVEVYGETFESWNNYTSTTSRSVNVDAGLKYSFVSISGSYSQEHVRMKSKQIGDNAVATRIQVRYLRYKALLQPRATLHVGFVTRLLSIASDLERNQTQSASYKAQLLVRDYGTHVLSRVTAGAGIVKTDLIKRAYYGAQTNDKQTIQALASASFADIFSFGAKYKQITEETTQESYAKSVTHSYITTHGGPVLRPFNMTISEWADGVDSDMVAMDRAGDPLFFLINDESFPNLPAALRDDLQKTVQNAIEQYYEMNVIRGCTKRLAPNFSFLANFNDGSCDNPRTNLTFGGFYQTCTTTGRFLTSDPCEGLNVVNPLTKGNTCPTKYSAVHLHAGTKLGSRESRRDCHSCGFLGFSTCCHYNYFQAQAHYDTYWCAATSTVEDQSGYLFGGIFSSTSVNLLTGKKKCPKPFYARRIFQDHSICLSDDYELASPDSVPFGGFTSCTAGNPLAIGSDSQALGSFLQEASKFPKRCPQGFSQHLAAVDSECAIRYCIQTGALTRTALIAVKRPPFSVKPESIRRADVYLIVNNTDPLHSVRHIVSQANYEKAIQLVPSQARASSKGNNSVKLIASLSLAVFMCVFSTGHLWSTHSD